MQKKLGYDVMLDALEDAASKLAHSDEFMRTAAGIDYVTISMMLSLTRIERADMVRVRRTLMGIMRRFPVDELLRKSEANLEGLISELAAYIKAHRSQRPRDPNKAPFRRKRP
ncbi:hypothetical protein FJZ48_02535 [Candidatus Uhrbacteria bacterium]|nr:hypothetical protein [Candidatus Uhrbacteria bacterium]